MILCLAAGVVPDKGSRRPPAKHLFRLGMAELMAIKVGERERLIL
jgi:hypothetical protein